MKASYGETRSDSFRSNIERTTFTLTSKAFPLELTKYKEIEKERAVLTSMQVAKSGDFRQGSISAIEPSYNTTFCKLGQGFVSPGICFIRVVFNVCIIITIKGHNPGHDMEPLSMATMESLGEIYSSCKMYQIHS